MVVFFEPAYRTFHIKLCPNEVSGFHRPSLAVPESWLQTVGAKVSPAALMGSSAVGFLSDSIFLDESQVVM